ncbi:hypothetical protein ES703_98416 [subsurface metagenome]
MGQPIEGSFGVDILRIGHHLKLSTITYQYPLSEIRRKGQEASYLLILNLLACFIVVLKPDDFRFTGFKLLLILGFHSPDNLVAHTSLYLLSG